LDLPLAVRVGGLAVAKPLLLWVNDGLIAIFFMLVGLEVKPAVVEDELSRSNAALPVITTIGGMVGPALVYLACDWGDADALRGWCHPDGHRHCLCARRIGPTGILGAAFAEDIFAGPGIIDDLGAIIIIECSTPRSYRWSL
jgi:Na+:H+ antiporter, NhaA family